jgi:hypothetical protein
VSIPLIDPGPPNLDFERPADRERLDSAVIALEARGFIAKVAASAEEAKQLVLDALPEGAEVHVSLSETMKELGVTQEIDESGRWDSVRNRLNTFDRETQLREMRKLGAAPDYIVGSAAAVTDDGQIVVGSGSGSQLGAYAYAGGNVILVFGHQKLVRDVDEGLRRIREYVLPREYVRLQGMGYPGSRHSKTLIIHYEPAGRISVILVPERLGF